jgi:hypothetical protein
VYTIKIGSLGVDFFILDKEINEMLVILKLLLFDRHYNFYLLLKLSEVKYQVLAILYKVNHYFRV